MGRIKIIAIKTLGEDLILENPGKFTVDFEKNKKVLGEVKEIKSKKVRNILAGYITRRMHIISKTGL